jgi:signal transduction histidine kinase
MFFFYTQRCRIRTPLSGIIGLAAQLMDTNLTSEQVNLIKTIQLCSDFLLVIVNDILVRDKSRHQQKSKKARLPKIELTN